eukprot:15366351-Ditylum_brightwellii.AAC.1
MDFTRKTRWVLDGHITPDPVGSKYADMAASIQNAYLQELSCQRHYIVCGAEFGLENVGKQQALIRRALYGGKSAGKGFCSRLRECMRHLGVTSCPADQDIWIRPASQSDGSKHYEFILLHVDDTLAIGEDPEKLLCQGIGKCFQLKEELVGPPKIYLGRSVCKRILNNGVEAWEFSSSQYCQTDAKNVAEYLAKKNDPRWAIPAKAEAPMEAEYRPELDSTPVLSLSDSTYYQSLIGMLRWMIELGRIDICLEVSLMASHLVMPREGHMTE